MLEDQETVPEIDWDEVRQRLEEDDSTVEFSDEELSARHELSLDMLFDETTTGSSGEKGVSREKMRAILEARARALSRVHEVETGDSTQLVVFSLADETYGIPTGYVREVQPLREISPVPCTPDFVVGIINIRGSIYSVVDIRKFLGVPEQEITALTKVILVNTAGLEVGILADDVSGSMSVPLAEIKPPLATAASIKEEYVQGVTSDMLIILNLEALMRDERIIVHEEVA